MRIKLSPAKYLTNATLLVHPRHDFPISVAVHASNIAVGVVLQQLFDNTWQPIAFYSRKLSPTEARYSTFGRELLAILQAIKHFRNFLESRHFFVLIDHKPLRLALKSGSDKFTPRKIRQMSYISEFTTYIRHIKGEDNLGADALSRIIIPP